LDASGNTWKGPSPKWMGYQDVGAAFVFRGSSGAFKASSPWTGAPAPGINYGSKFGRGENVTAIRHGRQQLEFLVDGKSQGVINLTIPMPDDVVGCVGICGGGAASTAGIAPTPTPGPPPIPPTPSADTCNPARITDSDNAGCGRWLPRFHPKNAKPLAHNNDANAPFELNSTTHLFMQANFPGVRGECSVEVSVV
jgi:hypothetical protein